VKKFVALALAPALIIGGIAGGGSLAGAQSQQQQQPERVDPLFVGFTVTPRRDSRRPFRFRVTGRVGVPNQLPPQAQGCPPGVQPGNPYCRPQREKACENGRVAVRYKTGRRLGTTISLRRFRLRNGPDAANPWFCEFSGTTRFRNRKRFGGNRLKVTVRFLGNDVMDPKSGTPKIVSVRRRR
jgi:hypothetical protein